jgi:hypothetical protein
MFPATTRLAEIYAATDYLVWCNGQDLLIRVGKRNASIDWLLSRFKCRSAALVTAWNPFGMKFSKLENHRAHRQLLAALNRRSLAYAPGEGRGSIGDWPPERSVLVFGLNRLEAKWLGQSLRQNAIVFVSLSRRAELIPLR